jgi:hypothetical protein
MLKLSKKRSSKVLPISFIALAMAAFSPKLASAKVFRNSYVSFELPDRWDCKLEQTEFVCRTNDVAAGSDPRQAAIILTAKEVGPQDNPTAYENHLKSPYRITGRDGKIIQSELKQIQTRNINGHPWIDGMHLNSEVPNYFTRYLATTKDRVAVLITFSAHQLYYTKFSADFFRAIESLRLVFSKSTVSRGAINAPGSEIIGTGGGGPAGGMGSSDYGDLPAEGSGSRSSGGGSATTILGIFGVIAALGFYFLVLKKKKKDINRPF